MSIESNSNLHPENSAPNRATLEYLLNSAAAVSPETLARMEQHNTRLVCPKWGEMGAIILDPEAPTPIRSTYAYIDLSKGIHQYRAWRIHGSVEALQISDFMQKLMRKQIYKPMTEDYAQSLHDYLKVLNDKYSYSKTSTLDPLPTQRYIPKTFKIGLWTG